MKVIFKIILSVLAIAIFSWISESIGGSRTIFLWAAAGSIFAIWKWEASYVLYGIGVGVSYLLMVRYGYSALWVPAVFIILAIILSRRKDKNKKWGESESRGAKSVQSLTFENRWLTGLVVLFVFAGLILYGVLNDSVLEKFAGIADRFSISKLTSISGSGYEEIGASSEDSSFMSEEDHRIWFEENREVLVVSVFEGTLKMATEGCALSQWLLGTYYLDGDVVDQDEQEAVKWFTRAAVQDCDIAQYYLGECYYYGTGTTQNYNEAVRWFKQSAKLENKFAQYMVGRLYYYGHGVLQDYDKAFRCFKLSAVQGYADAQNQLADCYAYGEGTLQNYYEAVKWYKKSAIQGDGLSQCSLSFHYFRGMGVLQDYVEAYAWALHGSVNELTSELGNGLKEELYKEMMPEQISQGQIRAKELQKEMGE